MAPWPEQGSEPKAPDKDEARELPKTSVRSHESALDSKNDQASKSSPDVKEDGRKNVDHSYCKPHEKSPPPTENENLNELEENDLKALLEEAMAYRNPMDREGKSQLFKELLHRAEQDADKEEDKKAKPHKKKHGKSHRESVGGCSQRGGSLQNLHALSTDGRGPGRKSKSSRGNETLVSARAREGGSLPTNVNDLASFTSRATLEVGNKDDFPKRGGNATCLQTNKTSFGTEPTTAGLPLMPNEDDNFAPSTCVGPAESGSVSHPTAAPHHVSHLSIPPSLIHGEHGHGHVASSNVRGKGQRKVKSELIVQPPEEDLADGFLGLPFTAHWNRYSSFTLLDFRDPASRLCAFTREAENKKAVDENGNAVSSVKLDGADKKKRRVKTKNDRNVQTVYKADQIEGFRGGATIDVLLEYIEPSSNVDKKNKTKPVQNNMTKNQSKVHDDSKNKRRKDKFQRCTSLEEISKTKLEDLTEESSNERVNGSGHTIKKKQVTLDDAQLGKRSSWDGEDKVEAATKKDKKADIASRESIQDSDFHVVTKKKQKKKRRTGSGRVASKPVCYGAKGFPAHDRTLAQDGSSLLLHRHARRGGQGSSQQRRKSASSVPPSDKSDESSDTDSVHSLPISTTQSKVSGGSTPQASYANIAAKCASSPPTSGSHGNVSDHTLSTDTLPMSALREEYPPLSAPQHQKDTKNYVTKTVITKKIESVCVQSSVAVRTDLKPSHPCPVRRPPVILMDEPSVASPQVPSEITFGFEVNQSLVDEETENKDSAVPPNVVTQENPTEENLPTPAGPTYLVIGATPQPVDENLLQYIQETWKQTLVKLNSGQAKYYDPNEDV